MFDDFGLVGVVCKLRVVTELAALPTFTADDKMLAPDDKIVDELLGAGLAFGPVFKPKCEFELFVCGKEFI